MRQVHVIVRGVVQGVGYRYTLRLVADEAGVSGWTRNRRDGSVESVLRGAPDRVDAVLAWMAEGPPGARVDAAEVVEQTPEDSASDAFEVRETA